ncbi:dynein light chain 1, cytoplasmic-like isoform X1 [Tympanuchus pallidicinctus]|uniref:dynein light chain 1, cytoplasmic-like isoform X1 n=1 Tax=Tympanuchus pallidicinctus TaxID=109042 RepID=UPI0022876655|nr:dynein light chain 1, cytoplasmic-like isoform X1 [Tympanuchus pallidicinctus]
MGTDADTRHAGRKENAGIKSERSSAGWPMRARGGGAAANGRRAARRRWGSGRGCGSGGVRRARRAVGSSDRRRSAAPASATMSDRKAVIKNADMSEEMQQDAVECATQALEKYNIEKDIAAHIKKEFDKKYNPTWHCIVGRNFGSYVTHETKHFIYFYLGQVAILLFKSG